MYEPEKGAISQVLYDTLLPNGTPLACNNLTALCIPLALV